MRNELAGQSKNSVLIKISSLGSSVDDALNIYDQFIEHGNVIAELSTFVASSAILISLGAKTVRMNENSLYLNHKAKSWGFVAEVFVPEVAVNFLENLESTADGAFLNETQLEVLENRLALDQQIIEERDTANNASDAAIAERDTANTNLINAIDPFNAIDATISSTETPEAKVLDIRALLSKKLATQPA